MTRPLVVEAPAAGLLLPLAFSLPRRAATWCRVVERGLDRLGRRRTLAVALVGALAFGGSAAVGLLRGLPVPAIHDEFSYLLAADTFASGRLTNPPHPLWVHFESIHILQQPTYASMYPPGQGLALALGQVLFGHPAVGVWLSVGLACAALTWMLQAWLPSAWALLGGLLVLARLGPFSYWAQSYSGGAVAALGGALLFGALRRLLPSPRPRDAVLLGLGLALLANSRPYEGLLVTLPAAAVLLRGLLGPSGPPLRVTLRRVALPLGLVLALTAAAMAYYNWRVTGDPLRLPYQMHEERYSVARNFLWEPPRSEPAYRHQILQDFHRDMARRSLQLRSFPELAKVKAKRSIALWRFYLGPLLTLPLFMLPWALKNAWMCLAGLTCGALAVGLFVATWTWPHYAAPIAGVLYALVLQSMRHLRVWRWRGRPTGRVMVWAIVALCVALAPIWWTGPQAWSLERARILASLEEDGDRHLVIVRYGTQHHPYEEWVYNAADIDHANVVWAREMDAARNRELLQYFKNRRAWRLEPDANPPKLTPYHSLGPLARRLAPAGREAANGFQGLPPREVTFMRLATLPRQG